MIFMQRPARPEIKVCWAGPGQAGPVRAGSVHRAGRPVSRPGAEMGAAAGAEIGSAVGGPIGTVVGGVVGYAVTKIVDAEGDDAIDEVDGEAKSLVSDATETGEDDGE